MLIGDKVLLRALAIEDIKKTWSWRNNLFIKESTNSHPFPITLEQEKQWYERILNDTSNKRIYFTVCDISSNDAIGFMFLDDIDFIHRRCVCGGAIGDTNLIGKGYGREAVGLLLSYAFKSLNLRRVYAYVMKDHPALKTWLATGAIIEAVLKEYSWVNGAHKDVCILSWEKSYL